MTLHKNRNVTSPLNKIFVQLNTILAPHMSELLHSVFPAPQNPQGSADLYFLNLRQDLSLYCKTKDTGLQQCTVCMLTPQLSLVLIAHTWTELIRVAGYTHRFTCLQTVTITHPCTKHAQCRVTEHE